MDELPKMPQRPRLSLVVIAAQSALVGLAHGPLARADQQAPMQHSPAFNEYEELEQIDVDKANERQTSSVKLEWEPIATANHYILKISRDPLQTDVVYSVDTPTTAYDTPELPPGGYYFSVQGLADNRYVGTRSAEPFVVGKPLSLTGQRERLPAPPIIGPKHLDLYPTYGYVRAAWQPVEGARGYRFRLWNEDKVRENQRWKRETPPRWITEVKQPWIEINDAPYSSYMYLETALYRWDVAAVDKEGGLIGDVAMGYFKTSRQWFLKPNEVFIRMSYGFAPNEVYHESSSTTGNDAAFNSSSHRLIADADWWFFRQWGVNLAGGFDTLNAHTPVGQPADTVYYINVSVGGLYRLYLSTVPWGWTLTLGAGIGLREFPQFDQFSPSSSILHAQRPKELGGKFGFRLSKQFKTPTEVRLEGNTLINAYTLDCPSGACNTGTPNDSDLTLKLLYHWSNHVASILGAGWEYHRAMFTPQPATTASNVEMTGINFSIGVQFNYYPPPDNSSYYPEHEGAFYPSERPDSYYHSERRNLDETHNDSSPWQRWRDRSR